MEKYGFVYLWYDKKLKRYYVGVHWGHEDDGYVSSSTWMNKAYRHRPQDFKRRIIKNRIEKRTEMYVEEQRWLDMIKPEEIKPLNPTPRYYNLNLKSWALWHAYPEHVETIGQKISFRKKGKNTGPRPPEVGAAISTAKKGKKFTEEHKAALRKPKSKYRTNQSEIMKKVWQTRRELYGSSGLKNNTPTSQTP